MRLIPIAAAFAGLAAIGPALADDSTAELATGGLAFVQTNDITMQSEDLYVSMDAIKARYEFVNTSDHDVTTLVAFPLPDIKAIPTSASRCRPRIRSTSSVSGLWSMGRQ